MLLCGFRVSLVVAGSCHGNLSGYEHVAAMLFWEVSRACYLVAKVF